MSVLEQDGIRQAVREVYGEAFSALMVTTTEEKMRAGYAALVDSVRRGDVLIVNAWYAGKHTEFVKNIKQDPRLKGTPVVIVSYKGREEDRLRGMDAGADYYLSKGSFHDDTLLDAVVDLIGEPQGASPG